MKIFVLAGNKKFGPFSLSVLRKHIRSGNFKDTNLACYDGKKWIPIQDIPGYFVDLPPPPQKVDSEDFTNRGFLLGEKADRRVRALAIYGSMVGFISHLILWGLHSGGIVKVEGETANLLNSPFSALYTPFSILLAYEAYQLIREIPSSFSNAVGKQFEIVTLLVVRDIFKSLSLLEFNDEWTLDGKLNLLLLECLTFVILFYTSMNYRKFSISLMVGNMEVEDLKTYVKSKRIIAQLLLFTYVVIAVLAFSGWTIGVYNGMGDADRKIFFLDFFTVLILADILILLMFYRYSDDFNALARNTGFVLATVILRVAIGAPGVSALVLFMVSGLLGIAILRITQHFYTPPSKMEFSYHKKKDGV